MKPTRIMTAEPGQHPDRAAELELVVSVVAGLLVQVWQSLSPAGKQIPSPPSPLILPHVLQPVIAGTDIPKALK